ncbi:hypothetical protein AAY473_036831, partial [Plecturocebus cupreus]
MPDVATWHAETENYLNTGGGGFSELRLCHCTPAWMTEQDSVLKKKWSDVVAHACNPNTLGGRGRVTKDRQDLQDPRALQAQEGHLGTQGKMAPVECQEYPVNQENQENKAWWQMESGRIVQASNNPLAWASQSSGIT